MLSTSTKNEVLSALGLEKVNKGVFDGETWCGSGTPVDVISPIDGSVIATVQQGSRAEAIRAVDAAHRAFDGWRMVPAPQRGEIVRQLGDELRRMKEPLAKLVTMEMGKCLREGLGEVQEMIDICDMACGMSRMLHGVQTHSERPRHRMFEQWHPLGVVGLITAFNFPVAVWSWNTAIGLVCGDTVVWKPASPTPLTAIACQKIMERVLRKNGISPAVATLFTGKGSEVGQILVDEERVPLVSYTGSTPIGKNIGAAVGKRLGRTILELGGNNAIIVTDKADLDMAVRSIVFGAIGTAGQRCTSTRRVIVNEKVYDDFKKRLQTAYGKVRIGDPLDNDSLMGPLVNAAAVKPMLAAMKQLVAEGGKILWGGEVLDGKVNGKEYKGGAWITPAVAEVSGNLPVVKEETFAPLLYLMKYSGGVEAAIALQNGVPQGLSSSIFTNDVIESETFLSHVGSDCGIANVNTGTSGAEIGLAFGGEKDTGGGRESGSDAWKQYMRRQTNSVNWSGTIALAQGIKFE